MLAGLALPLALPSCPRRRGRPAVGRGHPEHASKARRYQDVVPVEVVNGGSPESHQRRVDTAAKNV
ncbi:MAG: hypothetical protein QOD88_3328, partial [Mycobacterium sp.]|nr:hypothetical protein [Mycobacterium sp.]